MLNIIIDMIVAGLTLFTIWFLYTWYRANTYSERYIEKFVSSVVNEINFNKSYLIGCSTYNNWKKTNRCSFFTRWNNLSIVKSGIQSEPEFYFAKFKNDECTDIIDLMAIMNVLEIIVPSWVMLANPSISRKIVNEFNNQYRKKYNDYFRDALKKGKTI